MLQALNEAGLAPPAGLPDQWVVHCKRVGRGAPALEYLARYLYRGVIGEASILDDRDGHVTFRYTDGRTGESRTRTLPGEDFLHLVLQHVLPPALSPRARLRLPPWQCPPCADAGPARAVRAPAGSKGAPAPRDHLPRMPGPDACHRRLPTATATRIADPTGTPRRPFTPPVEDPSRPPMTAHPALAHAEVSDPARPSKIDAAVAIRHRHALKTFLQ